MKQNELPKTLQQAIKFFSDDLFCVKFLADQRWPDGKAVCPKCAGTENTFMEPRRLWQCKNKECRKQFSIKVGTIFEDSAIGLDKWLTAMWLIATCKNGVSSYEIHRAIGITQKSAWFVLHRIRVAMQNGSIEKLSGHVESDTTFIGGKGKNMHEKAKKARGVHNKGGASHMTEVLGAVERGGKVRAHVIPNSAEKILRELIGEYVERGSNLYTDQARQFQNMYKDDYIHWVINHTYEYVRENVYTNSIENFWSLLKRSIKGTYVSVAPEHLQAYVEEQAFRFNERKHKDGDRGRFVVLLESITGKRLTYADLIGSSAGH